ncbi:MAG: hypothetical protein VW124_13510 [Paracoccaceae bacterium]
MLKTIGIYALLTGSVFLILGAYFSAEFLKKINLEKIEVLLSDAQFEAKNNRRDVFSDWPVEVRYITDELINLKFSGVDADEVTQIIAHLEKVTTKHMHSLKVSQNETNNLFNVDAIFQRFTAFE